MNVACSSSGIFMVLVALQRRKGSRYPEPGSGAGRAPARRAPSGARALPWGSSPARTRRAGERSLGLSMLRLFRQHFPFLLSPTPSMAMLHARVTPRAA